ncbi:MAG: hypothetical protein P8L45_01640 [Longimicrobiales bacterium]|nr:hypothetical protein [Longimicrobiales bacterium]
MQSNVESQSGAPLPKEPETGADATGAEGAFGLDGTLLDTARVSDRLDRRLRRQSALYGHDTARRYLARLLELDAGQDDFYDRADEALAVAPGSIHDLIEGLEQ